MYRTLYDYNAWANTRILDTAARLAPEQYTASIGASFPSVRDTLVHTMDTEWTWLGRWQGTEPCPPQNLSRYASLAALRARWAEIDAELRVFVGLLDAAGLTRIVHYANSRRPDNAYPQWQLLSHVVNHGTQHRSEVAAMLTQCGHSPGDLDITVWLDTQRGRSG